MEGSSTSDPSPSPSVRLNSFMDFQRSQSFSVCTPDLELDGEQKMRWPMDLVLVRHGESEGNLAHALSRLGDNTAFEHKEWSQQHSSQWRLTARGIQQARTAGQWISDNVGAEFDGYYTSEYIRALETAALLQLPSANWKADFYLRERDFGVLDPLTHEQRMAKFADEVERRRRDAFFWQPPGGESLATVAIRIDRVLSGMRHAYPDKRVIVVCHGEVMWAIRVRLENMSQAHFRELELRRDSKDTINNCQILHYTRRDPFTGQLSSSFSWMRSVCPWDLERTPSQWRPVRNKRYSNADLLHKVAKVPLYLEEHCVRQRQWRETCALIKQQRDQQTKAMECQIMAECSTPAAGSSTGTQQYNTPDARQSQRTTDSASAKEDENGTQGDATQPVQTPEIKGVAAATAYIRPLLALPCTVDAEHPVALAQVAEFAEQLGCEEFLRQQTALLHKHFDELRTLRSVHRGWIRTAQQMLRSAPSGITSPMGMAGDVMVEASPVKLTPGELSQPRKRPRFA